MVGHILRTTVVVSLFLAHAAVGLAAPATRPAKPATRLELLYLDARVLTSVDGVPNGAAVVLDELAGQPTWSSATTGRPRVAALHPVQVVRLLAAYRDAAGAKASAAPPTMLVPGRRVTAVGRTPTTFPSAGRTMVCRTGFEMAVVRQATEGGGALPLQLRATATSVVAVRPDPADPVASQPVVAAWAAEANVAVRPDMALLVDLGDATVTPEGTGHGASARALALVRFSADPTPAPAADDPITRQVTAELYRAWAASVPLLDHAAAAIETKRTADARTHVASAIEQLRPTFLAAKSTEYARDAERLKGQLDLLLDAVQRTDRRAAVERLSQVKRSGTAFYQRLGRHLADWGDAPMTADVR